MVNELLFLFVVVLFDFLDLSEGGGREGVVGGRGLRGVGRGGSGCGEGEGV